jgi:hypothetical protein
LHYISETAVKVAAQTAQVILQNHNHREHGNQGKRLSSHHPLRRKMFHEDNEVHAVAIYEHGNRRAKLANPAACAMLNPIRVTVAKPVVKNV